MESLRKNYEENYINDYKDGNTKNLEYPDMNKKAPSIPPEALEKLK